MGTRGLVGFVVDGTEKIAYCHWDSYPSGLGADVLTWLRGCDIATLTASARALRVVDPHSEPTEEDVERLQRFADTGVSGGQLTEWYVLLRGTQGDPAAMLEAGVIEDGSHYGGVAWTYLVDLDAQVFVAYEGVPDQDAPLATWPLSALPTDDEFLAKTEGES